jgi:hypothetical protein
MNRSFGPNYNIKFYNRSTDIRPKNSLRKSQLNKIGTINYQSYRNSLRNSNLYNSISLNNLSSVIPSQNPLTSQIPSLRYSIPNYTTLQNTNLATNYNDIRASIQMASNPNSIEFVPIQTSSLSDFNGNNVPLMNNSLMQQPILLNNGLNVSNIGIVNSPYIMPTSLQPVSFINTAMPMALYNGYSTYNSYFNNQPNYGVGQYILNYPISNFNNVGEQAFYQTSSQVNGYELDSYEPDVEDNNLNNTSMEIGSTGGSTKKIKRLNIKSNESIYYNNLDNNLPLTENQTVIEDKNYTYEVVKENVDQVEEVPSLQFEDYKNNDTNIDYNSNEIYTSNGYGEYQIEPLETKSDNNIINYETTIIEPKVEEIDYTNINTAESIPEEKTVYAQDQNIDLTNVESSINSETLNNYTTLPTIISNISNENEVYTTNNLELDSIEKNDNQNYVETTPIEENNIITSVEYTSEPSNNNNTQISMPLESESIKENDIGYYLPVNDLENNSIEPVNETINPLKSYNFSSNLLESDSLNKIYDSYQLTSSTIDNNNNIKLTKSIPIKRNDIYETKPLESESIKNNYDSYELEANPVENNNIISTDSTSNPLNENYVYTSEPIISESLKENNDSNLLTSNNVENNIISSVDTTSNILNENYVYT